MIKFQFLGTGDVAQVPVFGCPCDVCERARHVARFRRKPCSARLQLPDAGIDLLIDGGLTDLCERFQPGQLSAILLTHYHVDHVQGLFHLRWGQGEKIPVFGPDDTTGCADLLKHPGILAFQPVPAAFVPFQLGPLQITPIPLQHSKPTYGYLFRHGDISFAYLTDTVGLPPQSLAFLQQIPGLKLAIDCTHPPSPDKPRNHNDFSLLQKLAKELPAEQIWLTHISHEMDRWLLRNPLPEPFRLAWDDLCLELD
ncbi:phosphonate metabolism protein PhnP [Neptuniibacter halophilus]|uniref:phosphonate metabolism protein PhnP n=1 Tax=Neptuniibacter halophilus TaxID=651666 RepID=UPI0025729A03|nr:phosphonate metabolism protein PhnP [Neptuniibacter halophilus]